MKFERKLSPEEFNNLSDAEVDDYIKFINFNLNKQMEVKWEV